MALIPEKTDVPPGRLEIVIHDTRHAGSKNWPIFRPHPDRVGYWIQAILKCNHDLLFQKTGRIQTDEINIEWDFATDE